MSVVALLVLGVMGSLSCQTTTGGETAPTERRQPNIIFIMADDLGSADLGMYGDEDLIQTPNLDRMAAAGLRFTQVYAGAPVCAPSRSVLMTGLHMGHTPVRGNTGGIPLPDEAVTVAEVLQQAGYATGGFGKWGLGDVRTEGVPEKQGFDVFFGYYHQIHAHYYYPDYLWRNSKKIELPGIEGDSASYSHYRIYREAMDFIRKRADEEQPFFAYLAFTPPHGKFKLPPSDPALMHYQRRSWNRDEKTYAAMVTMLDRQVGKLFDLLEARGIDDETIVFFASDNGGTEKFANLNTNGSLRGYKRVLYEGGLRVPMIVRWPGHIEAGRVSDLPWYFPDVMPTLAELAGAVEYVPSDTDGLSVVPVLLGRENPPRHAFMYWEQPAYDWGTHEYVESGLGQAVRHGSWKLVRHREDEPWELYNLTKDPAEEHDVARTHPEVVARLVDWIETHRTPMSPQVEPEMPAERPYR